MAVTRDDDRIAQAMQVIAQLRALASVSNAAADQIRYNNAADIQQQALNSLLQAS